MSSWEAQRIIRRQNGSASPQQVDTLIAVQQRSVQGGSFRN
jgi:hypothetical protein